MNVLGENKMRFSQENKQKIIFIISSVLGFTLIMGNACGEFESAQLASSLEQSIDSCPMGNCAAEAVPGEKTVSVIPANRVLPSMEACLGMNASNNTWTSFVGNGTNGKRESLSTDGESHTLNAAALMALSQIAGEICQDLVTAEKAKANDLRIYFKNINFARGPIEVKVDDYLASIQKLGRNCWARDVQNEELELIKEEVLNLFSQKTASIETDRMMITTCAAVLSSAQFYQQ